MRVFSLVFAVLGWIGLGACATAPHKARPNPAIKLFMTGAKYPLGKYVNIAHVSGPAVATSIEVLGVNGESLIRPGSMKRGVVTPTTSLRVELITGQSDAFETLTWTGSAGKRNFEIRLSRARHPVHPKKTGPARSFENGLRLVKAASMTGQELPGLASFRLLGTRDGPAELGRKVMSLYHDSPIEPLCIEIWDDGGASQQQCEGHAAE